jgi:hypothetical protein
MPATFSGAAALASGAKPLTPRAMPDAITARRDISMLVISVPQFFIVWTKKHRQRLKTCQARKLLENRAFAAAEIHPDGMVKIEATVQKSWDELYRLVILKDEIRIPFRRLDRFGSTGPDHSNICIFQIMEWRFSW